MAAIEAAQPFRDDALGAGLAYALEELRAATDYMVDIDNPLASGLLDNLPQQRFPILDRGAP